MGHFYRVVSKLDRPARVSTCQAVKCLDNRRCDVVDATRALGSVMPALNQSLGATLADGGAIAARIRNWSPRPRWFASAVALALVLAACAGPAHPVEDSPGGSVEAPGSELVPTALLPEGLGTQAGGLVADGSGSVWVRGPWDLTRVDAATGHTQTWDAADDAVFAASDPRLAPATGAGVWLVLGTRVRLFDGSRFAVDLTVPESLLAEVGSAPTSPDEVPATAPAVLDVAQVAGRIWLSVGRAPISPYEGNPRPLRVVAYSDSQWTSQEVAAWAARNRVLMQTSARLQRNPTR